MAQGVRGSVSHWLHSSPTWPKPADGHPQASSNVDVLIVGGGITGCSLAYHLRHLAPTLKVCVVEARGISEGATGRNGGLMWPSLNSTWDATVAQYGLQGAKQLMAFELHAYQDINAFIGKNNLAERLQFSVFPDGGLTLCETQEEMDAELSDLAAQQRDGVQPFVRPVSAEQLTERLGHHTFVGGFVHDKVARVTAVRLAHALLEQAACVEPRAALTVLQHTRVVDLQRLPPGSGPRFKVICRQEDTGSITRVTEATETAITAARVVHCTNGYNHLLPQLLSQGWLVPVRNQVVVTAPLPPEHPLPDAAFYARMGYVYWSKRHDGRVVLGGFRDVTSHMEWGTSDDSSQGLDPHVSFQMRRYLPTVLPDLFATSDKPANDKATHSTAPGSAARPMLVAAATAARADGVCGDVGVCGGRVAACGKPEVLRYELEWSGILGFTKDRWPLWGALHPALSGAGGAKPLGPSYEYACMGFSGHGMTRAYTCARNLALLLTGRALEPSFPARLFSPDRILHDSSSSSTDTQAQGLGGLPAPVAKL